MKYADYKHRLCDLLVTSGMSQQYHQILKWRFGWGDRIVRIVVGILAAAGVALSAPGLGFETSAFVVAILALIVAVILNIVPLGDKEKEHAELFRLWSDLRKDAEIEEFKTIESNDDGDVGAERFARLSALREKASALHGTETAAWEKTLEKCRGDEYERTFGKGLRTCDDVERERAKLTSSASATEQESATKADAGAAAR